MPLFPPANKIQGATDGTLIGNDGNQLLTDAQVTVEELLGEDRFADSWFTITNAGAASDTIRVQIPDDSIDVTTTVVGGDTTDDLTQRVIDDLNADGTFSPLFSAKKVLDNPVVHIGAKKISEAGERPDAADLVVTATGTVTLTLAFDKIEFRAKVLSLVRDPRDPRAGILGISGTVLVSPGGASNLFLDKAENSGLSDMAVDGSSTPVVFSIDAIADFDIFINEMRIVGNDNGIKFGQFLGINTALTNGIEVKLKSDDVEFIYPLMMTTDDLKHSFSWGPGPGFQLDVQAGRDDVLASFNFGGSPFPIRKAGSFSTDDFIQVKIQDDVSSVITLEFIAQGFKRSS